MSCKVSLVYVESREPWVIEMRKVHMTHTNAHFRLATRDLDIFTATSVFTIHNPQVQTNTIGNKASASLTPALFPDSALTKRVGPRTGCGEVGQWDSGTYRG
jgi:hypothetical protein